MTKKQLIEAAREHVANMDMAEFMEFANACEAQYIQIPVAISYIFNPFETWPTFDTLKFDKITCEWSINSLKL